MQYFSSELSREVNSLVEREVQKKMKGSKSRSSATKSTNEDIITEKINPDFRKQLKKVMKNYVLPILKAVVQVGAVVGVATCSLM